MFDPKFKLILLAVLGVIEASSSVYAYDGINIDKVEVVSQTPLATLGVPINEVPSNVQVATAKDVAQQQSTNLADFINDNLGSVNISNGTGNPFQPDVEYRGFTASPQLGQPAGLSVFFDGVRVNEPLGDIVNWDLIPMNAIAGINLMPGSNPLFGLNTLGGALAVTTKNGADFPGTNATVSGGSLGGRQFQVETGGEIKEHNLDYFVAGNFYHQDGWREATSSDVNQIFGKVRWHSDVSALELSLALADNNMNQGQTLPMSMMSNPKQAYTGPDWVKNQMAFVNLKGSTFLSDTKLLEGNVYYRRSNSQALNSNAAIDNSCDTACAGWTQPSTGGISDYSVDASNAYSHVYQTGVGTSAQMSFLDDVFAHKNKFTGGASVDVSRVTFNQSTYTASLIGNQTINDPSVTFDGLRNSLPYLQDQVNFQSRNYYYGVFVADTFAVNDQFNLSASARYNVAQVELSGTDDNFYNGILGSSLAGSHTYSRLNPSVGFTYNPNNTFNFYGGYNEGMRAPNALELECSNPSRPCTMPVGFTADPDLKMVVAKTWEGGVRGSIDQNWHWNAGAFVTNTYNDIQLQVTNGSQGYFNNVGTTRRQGIEFGLNGKVEALTLSARYSFVDATYQSKFSMNTNSSVGNGTENIAKGNQLPGIARNTLKLRAGYDLTREWNIGANVVLASSQWAHGDEFNQDPSGKIAGYGVMHLDTRYNLSPNWQVFGKVTNVFDKQYSTYGILNSSIYGSGNPELFVTPSMPRAAWVGVTYSFGGAKKSASEVDKD